MLSLILGSQIVSIGMTYMHPKLGAYISQICDVQVLVVMISLYGHLRIFLCGFVLLYATNWKSKINSMMSEFFLGPLM